MYFLHYPTGGFGHYMLQMTSICFDSVFCPQKESTFSNTGNSHAYPLHYKTWLFGGEYECTPLHNFNDLNSICLIDSGIRYDNLDYVFKKYPDARVIRMCIDDTSRSIVNQTCKLKGEESTWSYYSELNWERREQFTFQYHFADKNPDYFLNNFKPDDRCINLNISDLIFNVNKVLDQLSLEFGGYDYLKFTELHSKFIVANEKYARAISLVKRVNNALEHNYDFKIDPNYYSLHDQGYLNYWLEKQYNIIIPPLDYKDWFYTIDDIKKMIQNEKNIVNN